MSSPSGPQDNRPFVGLDGTPVRCQMETSFLSILESAGLKEWATQQNELGSPTPGEATAPDERNKGSTSRKSSRRPPSSSRPHKSANTRHGGRSRKSKNHSDKKPRPGQSKNDDGRATTEGQDEETEARRRRAESFVPDYSGYNTMDTELDIIRQQLTARKEK